MKVTNKLCTGLILMLLAVQINAFAQQQFSGKWKLAVEKSDFGSLEKAIAAPMLIDANVKDTAAVSRVFEGKEPFLELLTFGAKEVETLPDGNTLRRAKVSWIKDKKNIQFDWYYEIGGNEWHYTRTETWNLSDDGKVLTVDRVTVMPEKTDKVKAVYNRE